MILFIFFFSSLRRAHATRRRQVLRASCIEQMLLLKPQFFFFFYSFINVFFYPYHLYFICQSINAKKKKSANMRLQKRKRKNLLILVNRLALWKIYLHCIKKFKLYIYVVFYFVWQLLYISARWYNFRLWLKCCSPYRRHKLFLKQCEQQKFFFFLCLFLHPDNNFTYS